MDHAAAYQRLSADTQADLEPTLNGPELDSLLVAAAIPDTDGHPPSDPAWTPTYHPLLLNAAAADGWRRKASKAAALPEQVTADDATVRHGRGMAAHCLQMAAMFSARAGGGTGTLTSIDLSKRDSAAVDLVPVNAREPEGPDWGAAGTWPHGVEARR